MFDEDEVIYRVDRQSRLILVEDGTSPTYIFTYLHTDYYYHHLRKTKKSCIMTNHFLLDQRTSLEMMRIKERRRRGRRRSSSFFLLLWLDCYCFSLLLLTCSFPFCRCLFLSLHKKKVFIGTCGPLSLSQHLPTYLLLLLHHIP